MLVCQRVYLLKNVELHFQVLLFVLWNNEFSDNNDARRIRFEPPGAVPTDDLFFLPPSICGAPPVWSIPFNFSGWSKSVGWFHWQDSTTAWHEQEWMKGMDTSKWRSWYEFQEIISLHEPRIPMAAPLADLIKTLFPQLLGSAQEPTAIQAHCWPYACAGRHVIGISKTGSLGDLGVSQTIPCLVSYEIVQEYLHWYVYIYICICIIYEYHMCVYIYIMSLF